MLKKCIRLLSAAIIVMLFCGNITASALTSKLDYQYDEEKKSIPGPITYSVENIIYGSDFGIDAFNSPADIFVDENNYIYIADSGNNRIVILDEKQQFVKNIDTVLCSNGNNSLSNPQGIFVKNNIIYICDTGNSRVIAVNEENKVIRYIEGENLLSVNENFVFKPEKVVVDSNDNIFVSSSSVYQGIIRFDNKNEFKSFFAPNQVPVTFETFVSSLLKSWFTDEQKENIQKKLPSPYSNIYITEDNFIYATAKGVSNGQDIKCLNSAGSNILEYSSTSSANSVYGDYETKFQKTGFIDINCDDYGYMLAADSNTQKLFLYDAECNLLATFGGNGDEQGHFKNISAIEKQSDNYLVVDSEKNSITVMKPTDYINNVLEAMKYYRNGEYEQSEEIWEKLLMENSNFPFAYRSLGRAQYNLGNYKIAMKYLEMGGDKYFYSMALNGYRKEIVREYFIFIVLGAVVLIVLFVFLFKWIRKKLLS